MIVMGIASNTHHMLLAQSLSDPEISDLCCLFQVSFFSIQSSAATYSSNLCLDNGGAGVRGAASNFT